MIVADRYAKALIELAQENKQLEAVRADMKSINKLCDQNREFALFLDNPVINSDKKSAVLKSVLNGKVSDLTLSFVLLITAKHREFYMKEIAEAFEEQFKKNQNIFTAIVTSAQGLDNVTRTKVLELVKAQTKGEVELVEKIDNSAIGGFILKIGDKQIDKTVSRQLSNMKKELLNKGLN